MIKNLIDCGDIEAVVRLLQALPAVWDREDVERLCLYDNTLAGGNSFLHLAIREMSLGQLRGFLNKIPQYKYHDYLNLKNEENRSVKDYVHNDFDKMCLLQNRDDEFFRKRQKLYPSLSRYYPSDKKATIEHLFHVIDQQRFKGLEWDWRNESYLDVESSKPQQMPIILDVFTEKEKSDIFKDAKDQCSMGGSGTQ